MIAHQDVDEAEIMAAAEGLGIVRREVVEEFGEDDACGHGGALNIKHRTFNIER